MTQWEAIGVIAGFLIVFYIIDYFVWLHKQNIENELRQTALYKEMPIAYKAISSMSRQLELHKIREHIYFKALERLANPISFTGQERTEMTLELRKRIEYAYDILNDFRYASCANCKNNTCHRTPEERNDWTLCQYHISSQITEEEQPND